MKSYKSILFVAASIIIANNNHITQTGDSASSSQSDQVSDLHGLPIPPRSKDMAYLDQLKNSLIGIPESDIDVIREETRQKLVRRKSRNEILRKVVIDRVKINTRILAGKLTDNPEKIEALVKLMTSNLKKQLQQDDNLNGPALAPFFGAVFKRIVEQSINDTQKESKQETDNELVGHSENSVQKNIQDTE